MQLKIKFKKKHGRKTAVLHPLNIKGVQQDGFSGHFFHIFKHYLGYIVVVIFDLVHDVEAVFHIP